MENVVSIVRQPVIQNIEEGGQKWGSKLLTSMWPYYLERATKVFPQITFCSYVHTFSQKQDLKNSMGDPL